jgi:hypothetical protein
MADILTTVSQLTASFNQYIVSPLQAFGVGGFVFDIEGDANINLTNDITDHWLEDNSAVQDHAANKPKRVVLRNYIGELVYNPNNSPGNKLAKLAQKLTTISGFLPQLAAAAVQAKGVLDSVATGNLSFPQALGSAANIWGLIKNVAGVIPNRQQQGYMYFKALRDNKTIVSLQTPFEFVSNMMVESVVAFQAEESKYISTFTVTLKEIRTVSTQTLTTGAVAQDRNAVQAAPTVQNGNLQGLDPSTLPAGLGNGLMNLTGTGPTLVRPNSGFPLNVPSTASALSLSSQYGRDIAGLTGI